MVKHFTEECKRIFSELITIGIFLISLCLFQIHTSQPASTRRSVTYKALLNVPIITGMSEPRVTIYVDQDRISVRIHIHLDLINIIASADSIDEYGIKTVARV